MFDKIKFSQILKKIYDNYENQRDFSKKSEINRTYLSQYMNMKLDKPPKPDILERLAISSHGVTTYAELMEICGYSNVTQISRNTYTFVEITEYEWNLIFGNNKIVKLNTNEAIIWAEIVDNIDSDNHSTSYNLNNYLEKCNNENEKNTVTQLFYFFMLLLIKFINNTEEYHEFIADLEKRNLFDLSNKKESQYYLCPVLGKITAGQPILAEEYIEGYLPVDPNIYGLKTTDDLFYLLVSGQSMNMKVKNGDYALIRKQDYAEDGDIIVAIVNGDNEATLKRYKKLNEQFVLLEPMSTDPTIEAITVDLKDTKFQIIGKAIGQFGKF